MSFSVLICTYNRPQLLQKALEALVNRTNEKPDQIVIVNGGDEQADSVIESFRGQGVQIDLIKTVNRNLAASRNVGLPHCMGDIVAMTDDDAEVFPDWVTQMKRAHAEQPQAGAVGGQVLGTNTESLVGKVADIITFPSWTEPRYVRTLPGVNISYKRSVIQGIGYQDETLFRGEDVDFNWRVKQAGYEVYFDPSIKVYHHHRPAFRGLIQQQYMYGRAYYLVRRKWPGMYSVYPHQLRTMKDMLKLINFFASVLYQPFLSVAALPNLLERLLALPLLMGVGIAWKGGMLLQKLEAGGQT
jgi:GT2 family glycosyltransferase